MPFIDLTSQNSCESIAEIGFAVVIVGVGLEIIDLVAKWRKEHRNESILAQDIWWLWWIEAISVSLVVLGLSVEFLGGYKATLLARQKSDQLQTQTRDAFNKSAAAEKDAGESKLLAAQIGTTNAQLVATNLTLQKSILELEQKLQKQIRKISAADRDKFIEFSKKSTKRQVNLYAEEQIYNYDFEYRNYVYQFRKMLDAAGYNGEIIKEANFELFEESEYTNRDNPFFIVVYGQQGEVQWPGLKIEIGQDNHSVVLTRTLQDSSGLGDIDMAFKSINLIPDFTIRTDWPFVKTNGDWAIFIPPKL